MRLFVLEYVSAGGLGLDAPPSLRAEGRAMLAAMLADCAALPGIVPSTVLADAGGTEALPAEVTAAGDDPPAAWRAALRRADAAWLIAPETGGALESLTAPAPCRVLGSEPAAIRLAADKRATARALAAAGVPAVPTHGPDEPPPTPAPQGWVSKPVDGVGCTDTLWHRDSPPPPCAGRVVQPFLPGEALSLSLLAQGGAAWLLTCNTQDVAVEHGGRFRYRGGVVGGAEAHRAALAPLAAGVARAIPGLFGHVGVDVVLTREGPVVLEVNPRVTTAYVGLRESIGANPAALALALLDGPLAELRRPLSPRPVPVRVAAAA